MATVSKKIILVGRIGVGKTSLVRRYVQNVFDDEYLSTIGVKVDKKEVATPKGTVNLLIWDIAGEANFTKISESYYLGAHGCIFVADLSRINTFDNFTHQITSLRKKIPNIKIITIANKTDLIDKETLEKIKKDITFDYYTSAKKNKHVDEAFATMAERLIDGS